MSSELGVPSRWWAAAAALATLGALLVAFDVGSPLWFFADDWNVLDKYAQWDVLEPFNGHLTLVPGAVFAAMFHVFGLESYTPYRILGLVALAVFAWLLFRHVRSRAGAAVAAVVVAAVLWSSAAASNLLFPFLFNFTVPLAALVAIWWHLDRRSPRDDVAASAWLALALACSGLGLVAAFAVAVELLVGRAHPRRWLVMAPGPVLWLLWYLANREASQMSSDVAGVLRYMAEMVLGALTALAAGSEVGGVVLGVVKLVALLVRLRRGGIDGPRTASAVAALTAFVALTAVSRVDIVPDIPPDELRYAWTTGLLALMVLVALWPAQVREHRPTEGSLTGPRWPAGLALAVAVVVIALGGVELHRSMQWWTQGVTDAAPGIRSSLYVTEALGRERVDPSHVLPLSFVAVTASGYLDVVEAVGSPVAGVRAAQVGGDEAQRELADRRLVEELPIRLVAGAAPGCGQVVPGSRFELAPGDTLLLEVAPGRTGAGARIARFAEDDRPVDLGDLAPGGNVLHVPEDRGPQDAAVIPYRLRVDGGVVVRRCD